MSPALPALFVPHGAPTFALRPGAAGKALRALARRLPPIRAVVMVSAHWQASPLAVGLADRPATLHDFHGFPAELAALDYPASGCREAGEEVIAALHAAGLSAVGDTARGLDHGAWIPLRWLFPEAEVPVIPVSLPVGGGPATALALGRALAPLRTRGLLTIGSGNLTHNLHDFRLAGQGGGQPPGYVQAFTDWLAGRLAAGDTDALLDYRRRAPHAARAHPSEEHLLPLHVALGAAGPRCRASRLHAGIDDHVLAMDLYRFDPH